MSSKIRKPVVLDYENGDGNLVLRDGLHLDGMLRTSDGKHFYSGQSGVEETCGSTVGRNTR